MSADLIARLDRWLSAHRPRYHASLLPGAGAAALDAFESEFVLSLPPTYRALLEWHDGQDPTRADGLQHNWSFPGLERVAESKSILDGMVGLEFEDPRWWRIDWIPFLENGAGDHLCLDLTAEDGGVPGQVCRFRHDEGDRSIEYASIDRWLETFVESLEAGIWREDEGLLRPNDHAAWRAFHGERNPGYPVRRLAGWPVPAGDRGAQPPFKM